MPTFDVARIETKGRLFHVVKFNGRSSVDAVECNAFIARAMKWLKTPVLLLDAEERWYGEMALSRSMTRIEPSSLPWEARRMP